MKISLVCMVEPSRTHHVYLLNTRKEPHRPTMIMYVGKTDGGESNFRTRNETDRGRERGREGEEKGKRVTLNAT